MSKPWEDVYKNGIVVGHIYNNDPKDPDSWQFVFDEGGKWVGVVYGEDPKNPDSYMSIYKDGMCVGAIYGDDPKNPRSYMNIYDGEGIIGAIRAEDPKNTNSFRYIIENGECIGTIYAENPNHEYSSIDTGKQLKLAVLELLDDIAVKHNVQAVSGFSCPRIRRLAELISWEVGRFKATS